MKLHLVFVLSVSFLFIAGCEESDGPQAKMIAAAGHNTCRKADGKIKCQGFEFAGTETINTNADALSVGPSDACAISDGKLSCWDRNGLWPNQPPIKKATAVAVGKSHVCAIDKELTYCWGDNEFGQAVAPRVQNPRAIAAGDNHTCAIGDNEVICWGDNEFGQATPPEIREPKLLKAGKTATCAIDATKKLHCWGGFITWRHNLPVTPPADLAGVVDVAIGERHICALAGKEISCWGHDGYGQASPPPLEDPISLSGGYRHTCALDGIAGKVCWGDNNFRQITTERSVPQPVSIAVGSQHACGLFPGNKIGCWGANLTGQHDFPSVTNPTGIISNGSTTCVIDNGRPKCWGQTTYGSKPDLPDTDYLAHLSMTEGHFCYTLAYPGGHRELTCEERYPVNLYTPPVPIQAPGSLAVTRNHGCMIDAGVVQCWGQSTEGQLDVPALQNPKQIAVAHNYSCAIDDTGVVCWGSNRLIDTSKFHKDTKQIAATYWSLCGIGPSGIQCADRFDDHKEEYPQLINPTQLYSKEYNFCAVDETGIVCWGPINRGHEVSKPYEPNFGKQTRLLNGPKEVSVGSGHTCATDSEGIVCWGSPIGLSTSPPTVKSAHSLTSSDDYNCAQTEQGLQCWGISPMKSAYYESNIELAKIQGRPEPSYTVAGGDFGCGIFGDEVVCWGRSSCKKDFRNPVLLSAGDTYQSCAVDDLGLVCWHSVTCENEVELDTSSDALISSGRSHSCALTGSEVLCWGENDYGQTDVPPLSNPRRISAGVNNTCAIDDNGVTCWGDNSHGQNNVRALQNPTWVAAGSHSCAVDAGRVVCWGNNSAGQASPPNP